MKYYVVQDIGCYYVVPESNYTGDRTDVVAACPSEYWAKVCSKALAEYEKRNLEEE